MKNSTIMLRLISVSVIALLLIGAKISLSGDSRDMKKDLATTSYEEIHGFPSYDFAYHTHDVSNLFENTSKEFQEDLDRSVKTWSNHLDANR